MSNAMKYQDDAVSNGNVCPHCGELDTEMGIDYTHCETECELEVYCDDCDATWTKVYVLKEVLNGETDSKG